MMLMKLMAKEKRLTKNNIYLLEFMKKNCPTMSVFYSTESVNTDKSYHFLDDNYPFINVSAIIKGTPVSYVIELNETVLFEPEKWKKIVSNKYLSVFVRTCNYNFLKQLHRILGDSIQICFPLGYIKNMHKEIEFRNIEFSSYLCNKTMPCKINENLSFPRFDLGEKSVKIYIRSEKLRTLSIDNASEVFIYKCDFLTGISIMSCVDLAIMNVNCSLKFVSFVKNLKKLSLSSCFIDDIEFSKLPRLQCLEICYLKTKKKYMDITSLYHVEKMKIYGYRGDTLTINSATNLKIISYDNLNIVRIRNTQTFSYRCYVSTFLTPEKAPEIHCCSRIKKAILHSREIVPIVDFECQELRIIIEDYREYDNELDKTLGINIISEMQKIVDKKIKRKVDTIIFESKCSEKYSEHEHINVNSTVTYKLVNNKKSERLEITEVIFVVF
jgi:hypothetical protein